MNNTFYLDLVRLWYSANPNPTAKLQVYFLSYSTLATVAFACFKLLFQDTKPAKSDNQKTQYFFPHKEEKEKKKEKKRYAFLTAM
jgi:hypothetical protein